MGVLATGNKMGTGQCISRGKEDFLKKVTLVVSQVPIPWAPADRGGFFKTKYLNTKAHAYELIALSRVVSIGSKELRAS